MLFNILKRDFKSTSRLILVLIIASVILLPIMLLANYLKFDTFFGTMFVVNMLICIASVVVTIVVIMTNYYKTMHGTQGYLTHTLPVKSGTLFLSKYIVAIVWLVITSIISTGSIMASMFMIMEPSEWSEFIEMLTSGLELKGMIIYFVAIMAVSTIYSLTILFFSISFGSMPIFQKLGIAAPILVYFVLTTIVSIVEVVLMLVIPTTLTYDFITGDFALVTQKIAETSVSTGAALPIASVVLELVLTIAAVFATSYILKKKTSLK